MFNEIIKMKIKKDSRIISKRLTLIDFLYLINYKMKYNAVIHVWMIFIKSYVKHQLPQLPQVQLRKKMQVELETILEEKKVSIGSYFSTLHDVVVKRNHDSFLVSNHANFENFRNIYSMYWWCKNDKSDKPYDLQKFNNNNEISFMNYLKNILNKRDFNSNTSYNDLNIDNCSTFEILPSTRRNHFINNCEICENKICKLGRCNCFCHELVNENSGLDSDFPENIKNRLILNDNNLHSTDKTKTMENLDSKKLMIHSDSSDLSDNESHKITGKVNLKLRLVKRSSTIEPIDIETILINVKNSNKKEKSSILEEDIVLKPKKQNENWSFNNSLNNSINHSINNSTLNQSSSKLQIRVPQDKKQSNRDLLRRGKVKSGDFSKSSSITSIREHQYFNVIYELEKSEYTNGSGTGENNI